MMHDVKCVLVMLVMPDARDASDAEECLVAVALYAALERMFRYHNPAVLWRAFEHDQQVPSESARVGNPCRERPVPIKLVCACANVSVLI